MRELRTEELTDAQEKNKSVDANEADVDDMEILPPRKARSQSKFDRSSKTDATKYREG